ncbi:hypothetical protein SS1G_14062 [Sclerotinia sclerotiorum 1980 UF-70]|uniref:Anaphase-promoting complex subunit 4 WD40 domain-containing protein n=2 Tax=Sclerotinia sclerotiorum (strain ATCC 18683 / 1980 / Ss-1) TaxID=665079 RepID=A7F8Y1_SCLS1|nr:hypothetical protein SS1G_14062 [Sclerotinia sclerotiorum 1980 UF-70]APA13161.1 hypothetical protein sscle_10g079310 [Sclerotinia sclerotiorum 1980 UF-70]EDN99202.1 hypothetical protein SS1G_14062 [Sclerotinia sclerotiorum 1980 UF-70]
MEKVNKELTLVASTDDVYSCSIATSHVRERELREKDAGKEGRDEYLQDEGLGENQQVRDEDLEVNYFKSVQWTLDGTTLLTSSADNKIRTFILPPTLLDDASSPLSLSPYTTHTYPTPVNCIATYPHFTLSDPSTTLYLSCANSLPIRLCNILSPSSTPQASYNLICPTTEKYLTPSSILWSTPGTHFLTGTECLISQFDISHPGSGPLTKLPTIPSKRHKMKGGGVGMRGIVSALSLQSSLDGNTGSSMSMLAAGTWTRWVGLYDANGLGGTVGTWNISSAADAEAEIGGQGISELGWSACGRYLWIAERKSSGVLVYDVRVTGKLVSWLEGREAETNQRLGVGCFEGEKGMEIWAGGTDGTVRVWEGVGGREGAVGCDWEWKAHDGSTVLHPSGTVVATCSGQRAETNINAADDDTSINAGEESSDDESTSDSQKPYSAIRKTKSRTLDNSLKVWSL